MLRKYTQSTWCSDQGVLETQSYWKEKSTEAADFMTPKERYWKTSKETKQTLERQHLGHLAMVTEVQKRAVANIAERLDIRKIHVGKNTQSSSSIDTNWKIEKHPLKILIIWQKMYLVWYHV